MRKVAVIFGLTVLALVILSPIIAWGLDGFMPVRWYQDPTTYVAAATYLGRFVEILVMLFLLAIGYLLGFLVLCALASGLGL